MFSAHGFSCQHNIKLILKIKQISDVSCRCFDTLRTKVGQILENINSSSSDHRIVFLLFQFQEDGKDKENKVLGCEDCV